MRILMLNNEYPPLGGGTGTVNEALLKEFAEQPELDIDLITSAADDGLEECLLFDRFRMFRLPVDRFNIHHASNKELLLYSWRAFRYAKKIHQIKPYDLCMAWSTVPAGAAAFALKRTVGLPYLVRVTGPDIPGFEERYAGLYPVLKPFIRRIWQEAQDVVAKCWQEREMIRAVEPDVDVQIIPNGVDAGKYLVERPIYDGPLRILCVGRLIERKGQRDLIEAVRRLKNNCIPIRCRFVGAGDAEKEYRRLVAETGLEEEIEFSGYVPRERMPEIYAEADVFVLPSHNEGMSVAALEAMASGLPLLLSQVGGTSEIVMEEVNGWTFVAGDVDTIVQIVGNVSRDRNQLRAYGERSRKMAENKTWKSIAGLYSAHVLKASNI